MNTVRSKMAKNYPDIMFESSLRSRARAIAHVAHRMETGPQREHTVSQYVVYYSGVHPLFFFLSVFLFVFCNEHSAHSVSKIARARARTTFIRHISSVHISIQMKRNEMISLYKRSATAFSS